MTEQQLVEMCGAVNDMYRAYERRYGVDSRTFADHIYNMSCGEQDEKYAKKGRRNK